VTARHEGRTAREWVAELVARTPSRKTYPVDVHEALVALGPDAVPPLLELLRAPRLSERHRADSSLREYALSALMAMVPPPQGAVPVLLGLLSHPSARLRRQVLRSLVDLRARPTGLAVRRLLEACHAREDWKLRALGLDALAWLDGPLPEVAVAEALARLSDANRYVRRSALRLLSRLPAPSEAVLQALEEQCVLDDDNRPGVLQVLASASPARALPWLEGSARQLLGVHPEDRARLTEGLFALVVLAGMGARARPALGLLRELQAHALQRGHGDLVAWPIQVRVEAVLDGIVRAGPPLRGVRRSNPGSSRLAERLEAAGPEPEDAEHSPAVRLARWLGALGPLEREEEMRLALAMVRQAADLWDAHAAQSEGARSALFALETWVRGPSRGGPHGGLLHSQPAGASGAVPLGVVHLLRDPVPRERVPAPTVGHGRCDRTEGGCPGAECTFPGPGAHGRRERQRGRSGGGRAAGDTSIRRECCGARAPGRAGRGVALGSGRVGSGA
jgi:hypothetical protein